MALAIRRVESRARNRVLLGAKRNKIKPGKTSEGMKQSQGQKQDGTKEGNKTESKQGDQQEGKKDGQRSDDPSKQKSDQQQLARIAVRTRSVARAAAVSQARQ